jgi:hypothetical protein
MWEWVEGFCWAFRAVEGGKRRDARPRSSTTVSPLCDSDNESLLLFRIFRTFFGFNIKYIKYIYFDFVEYDGKKTINVCFF